MSTNYITKMVVAIMKKDVDSRDDLLIVVKKIHDFELSVLEKTKDDYYDLFFEGELSSFKTIDRVWRKVQEMKPELRGKNWELRQLQAGNISLEQIANKNQLKLFLD